MSEVQQEEKPGVKNLCLIVGFISQKPKVTSDKWENDNRTKLRCEPIEIFGYR